MIPSRVREVSAMLVATTHFLRPSEKNTMLMNSTKFSIKLSNLVLPGIFWLVSLREAESKWEEQLVQELCQKALKRILKR